MPPALAPWVAGSCSDLQGTTPGLSLLLLPSLLYSAGPPRELRHCAAYSGYGSMPCIGPTPEERSVSGFLRWSSS